jgi:protein-S-isoprenylcysteine O-methyltransferase Ste14
MSNVNSMQTSAGKSSLNRSGVSRLIQVFGSMVIMGIVLFLAAGRLDWTAAWVYLALNVLIVGTGGMYVARRNPDVINERGRIGREIRSWDLVLVTSYTLMLFVLLIVAGLDGVRFGWTTMHVAVQAVGGLGMVLAMVCSYWAMLSNPFLSTIVRIQDDRGHQVATTGPYRFVRHPMYVGVIVLWLSTALILGSWWALVPGLLIAVIFVIRTALEDRMLQSELPGYADYAKQVRYRLVPGVW